MAPAPPRGTPVLGVGAAHETGWLVLRSGAEESRRASTSPIGTDGGSPCAARPSTSSWSGSGRAPAEPGQIGASWPWAAPSGERPCPPRWPDGGADPGVTADVGGDRRSCRTVPRSDEPAGASPSRLAVRQLGLPGLAGDRLRPPPRRGAAAKAPKRRPADIEPLIQLYLRRLAARGAAPAGVAAYRSQLHRMLRAAARRLGRPVGMAEVFRDASLLGRLLVDDVGESDGRRLSRWTLAQRRSAARSFAALLGEDPHAVLDRALRADLLNRRSPARDQRAPNRPGHYPKFDGISSRASESWVA